MVTPRQKMTSVPTPALVLDLAIIKRNITRLAEYGRDRGIAVRPHTKTHKSRRMARHQLEAGAMGLTTAKAGEAEVMAEECQDITVAYPAVDFSRANRIAAVANRGVSIRVALDSAAGLDVLQDAARGTGATIGILVDIDVGFHRTGVQSPPAALELARMVSQCENLRLDGLFCYPGHVWSPADEQTAELRRIDSVLRETIELWRRDGLAAPIVSGGSTPTAYQSHLIPSLTEIRPGTYIFNDMNTVRAGFCELQDCAVSILCTVVSTAVPGKAILDGGSKTFTTDRNVTQPDSGHGYIVEYPAARLVRLSEEHGELNISPCNRSPKVGERINVIPNHICPCINLQDGVWVRTSDDALSYLPIDARGNLS